MPKEAKTAVAAVGIGNLAFYRMCADFPDHDDWRLVYDKLLFIARVYSVARGLGGNWEVLAKAIAKKADRVDGCINAAKREAFPANIDEALKAHALLDKIICKVLRSAPRKPSVAPRQVHGRPSLVSKYLHFHAPDAFPILDADATKALKKITSEFRDARGHVTTYDCFCRRFAFLMVEHRLGRMSLRHIDCELLRIGRNRTDLTPHFNWPSRLR